MVSKTKLRISRIIRNKYKHGLIIFNTCPTISTWHTQNRKAGVYKQCRLRLF